MNKVVFGLMILCLLVMNACVVGKKVVYVRDMEANEQYRVREGEPMKIQKGDRLRVTVHAKDPELAAPFNASSGAYRVDVSGNVEAVAEHTKDAQSYLVSSAGTIDFPVMGSIEVEGLSLEQVKERIATRLMKGGLIANPLVKVDMLSFKVSVLGAVVREDVLHAEDAKMTLMEAIALSGGLKPNAAPDRISVIREEGGVRKVIVNDIESRHIFDSPAYHLRQNDIVYVAPRSAEDTPRENRSWRFWTTAMGVVSIVLAALTLAK